MSMARPRTARRSAPIATPSSSCAPWPTWSTASARRARKPSSISTSPKAVAASASAFLAAGKYFLINNGPYYGNYDIPGMVGNWCNIFVYPGPARGWICRTPLTFDKWLPSVLFLTHYLPDDPAESQRLNIASLILGQNGIWGDLPRLSEEGIQHFASLLGKYKQVRDAITASDPVVSGMVGGSPEIHEKIARSSGQGVIVIFATAAGTYRYITEHQPCHDYWATEGVQVRFADDGRAELDISFARPGAQLVFFGVR